MTDERETLASTWETRRQMTTPAAGFSQLEEAVKQGGVAVGLAKLAEHLRGQQKYHELFEALKMQVRHSLGLPVLYNDSGDELGDSMRARLEEGLLSACREVGMALLKDGQIREGWMYLRPIGNRLEVAEQLSQIDANDDNLDALIEVCLHEGVDPPRGYRLVLENHGTCNAITTFESASGRLPKGDQQAAAELLVAHVHHELRTNLVTDISRQEGSEPTESSLSALVENRPGLFGEYSYHIDTTHLASTVRFARVLDDEPALRLAVDLTEYGKRLNEQFQYPGEEPFLDHYGSHALYLGALIGIQVEQAIAYFLERAEAVDPEQHGSQPVEAFVELLDRLGRQDEAIDAVLKFAERSGAAVSQILPLLLSLSEKANSYTRLIQFCRQRDDLLGFGTGLVQSHASSDD